MSTALEKWSEETGKQLNGQGQGLTVRLCFGGRWEVMTVPLKSHTQVRTVEAGEVAMKRGIF